MNSITSQYSNSVGQAATAATGKSLGQADFLRLMTEQMKQQDPTKPVDSTQMLAQLAQFSQVQGINDMQGAMSAMAAVMENDQALRAAQLVGTDAMVSSSSIQHDGSSAVRGQITADRAGPIQIDIRDGLGNLVARRTVQADAAGAVNWEWDGKNDAGKDIPVGTYAVAATAGSGDQVVTLDVVLRTRIDTVSFGNAGMQLNTALGPFTLSQLRQIG